MPKIRLLLPKAERHWTKVPNLLIDRYLPSLRDTELRVLLVLIRFTTGWNRDGRMIQLSYSRLKSLTGRQGDAIARALTSLAMRGLIHSTTKTRKQIDRKHIQFDSESGDHIKTI